MRPIVDVSEKQPAVLRIGSVSFLNAKPLIYELSDCKNIALHLDVPSRLLNGLRNGRLDVALLPVIDFQRSAGLRILTSGGIGCDGPTLTVRIFSSVPIGQIHRLACDPDSHTSVALARIVLAELYGVRPEFVDLIDGDAAGHVADARLLIGDKVISEAPNQPYEIDLGGAWKQLTGLPFVFAAWMARPGVGLGMLAQQLEAAKRAGLGHIAEILAEHAGPHGWPADIARKYLTEYLKFDIGPQEIEAMCLFHQLATKHGVIEHQPWELAFAGD